MGKRSRTNELQEYLENVKEAQDHQYSKGYWVGKVRRGYPKSEGSRIFGWYYILSGGPVVFMMVGIVIVGLARGEDLSEIIPDGGLPFAIVFFCIGLLTFGAGVMAVKRGRKRGH